MSVLDKTKPYGNVIGSKHGIRYEQAGKLFDVHGREVDGSGKPKTQAAPAAPDPAAQAPQTSGETVNETGEPAPAPVASDPASAKNEAKKPAGKKPAAKKAATKQAPPAGVQPLTAGKESGQ